VCRPGLFEPVFVRWSGRQRARLRQRSLRAHRGAAPKMGPQTAAEFVLHGGEDANSAENLHRIHESPRYPVAAMRRYHLTSFGCQMNAHDSERIKGMLEELGLGEAQDAESADVVVFNTCTIREKPDTKLAAHLGAAGARKRERPETVIAVGGCYAEAQRERIFGLYPQVDVAFGPRLRRRPAPARRAQLPGVGAGFDGVQLDLLVLHRPVRPRA
jgi:hypothetical protein